MRSIGRAGTRHGAALLAAVTCVLALLVAGPASAAKRVALVIGNDDYRNVPRLQKAVNDARTIGDALKTLGFQVMVAENQTRAAFSQSLLLSGRAPRRPACLR
jgi:ABC-type sugar transport system substrate-binding protein